MIRQKSDTLVTLRKKHSPQTSRLRLRIISQFKSLSKWMMEPPDDLQDDKNDGIVKKEKTPWYLIREEGIAKLIWDCIINLIYVLSFFLTLFELGFEMEPL